MKQNSRTSIHLLSLTVLAMLFLTLSGQGQEATLGQAAEPAQDVTPAVEAEAVPEEDAPMSFQSASGTLYQAGKNTELEVLDPLSSNPTVILTPKEGADVAQAIITEGKRETRLIGRKITFVMETENFQLDGNARIEQGKDLLVGPERITFDSGKNTMIARGTAKQLAKCSYIKKDGTPFTSEATELQFFFENVNGDRVLKRFKTINNGSSVFFRSKAEGKPSGQSIVPKLSPPK